MIRFKVTTSSMLVAGTAVRRGVFLCTIGLTHAPASGSEHSSGLGIPKPMQVEHDALHSDSPN